MGQSPHHPNPLRLHYPTIVLNKEQHLNISSKRNKPKLARVPSCTVNRFGVRIRRIEAKRKAGDPRSNSKTSTTPVKALSQNHTGRRQGRE